MGDVSFREGTACPGLVKADADRLAACHFVDKGMKQFMQDKVGVDSPREKKKRKGCLSEGEMVPQQIQEDKEQTGPENLQVGKEAAGRIGERYPVGFAVAFGEVWCVFLHMRNPFRLR